jgi:hypothetical protein
MVDLVGVAVLVVRPFTLAPSPVTSVLSALVMIVTLGRLRSLS